MAWRFWGRRPLPLEIPGGQQLKTGEIAFRRGDNSFALHLFQALAAKNDPTAEYWLAHMLELELGVPKTIGKAISLYAKAAARIPFPRETRLGEIYLQGDLTPPEYLKAFDLLGRAARHGSARAAMTWSDVSFRELGTEADQVEGYAWSEVAVVEGIGFAKIERQAAFAAMSPEDRAKGAGRAATLLAQ